MDRELYSIEQARALLGGIVRNTLHGLLRSGELASVPIGRRRFIAAEAIQAFRECVDHGRPGGEVGRGGTEDRAAAQGASCELLAAPVGVARLRQPLRGRVTR